MTLDFLQLDVFADHAYAGNPLAVFYDAPDLSTAQMQAIAREMNLSETTFVTSASSDAYTMRVFTPAEELPFAGHPTLGTTWALKHLGVVTANRCVQTTAAGPTPVEERDGVLWFERSGSADPDTGDDDALAARLTEALGLGPGSIGFEGSRLGRSGHLRPAFSDGGIRMLMVPLADVATLSACEPRADLLIDVGGDGAYCFTAAEPGHVRSRGFFPGVGVAEDPATGVAAAGLGIYLADRLGDIELEVAQGVEMGRPSRIFLRGRSSGSVEIGGRSELVFTGKLDRLPDL
jgi:trans-2,3-dihydro-3-hydroxyanthranilate isomerase